VIAAGKVSSPALVLAMLFIIGGFSFKIAAVPFHQWVPDVYQGAPTPVTAFISVSSKVAGYALLIRVLTSGLGPMSHQWQIYLAVIAVITMTVGNISALNQTSVKRCWVTAPSLTPATSSPAWWRWRTPKPPRSLWARSFSTSWATG
jgi:NADH:ubiquinone oxidoreductase subunit 2 (subunit N)